MSSSNFVPKTTNLPKYLDEHEVDEELKTVICQAVVACIEISNELKNLPIVSFLQKDVIQSEGGETNIQGEVQKPMDVIANNIFIEKVQPHVGALASEENEEIIPGTSVTGKYEIAFDPLDGSSNLDVSIPTGTIFGISYLNNQPFTSSGRSLVASGYAVYSSSLEIVIGLSLGDDRIITSGFTLCTSDLLKKYDIDLSENEMCAERLILSRPYIKCPEKGCFYSLNDGREPDWPEGLRKWIHDAKRGKTPSGTIYSSRYVCSLCADVHRTFIKGGWAGNPRPHLRLLYEAAPLAHIAQGCGAKGSDGTQNLLDIKPKGLHDRTCVFIGSICDILELESYGDVQQSKKIYKV